MRPRHKGLRSFSKISHWACGTRAGISTKSHSRATPSNNDILSPCSVYVQGHYYLVHSKLPYALACGLKVMHLRGSNAIIGGKLVDPAC